MQISNTGRENLRILEISRGKSCNSGTSLNKTWVLTISAKHLHIYGLIVQLKNHSLPNYDNQSQKITNFIDLRRNDCIFIIYQSQRNHAFKKISRKKNRFFNNQCQQNVQNLTTFGKIITYL